MHIRINRLKALLEVKELKECQRFAGGGTYAYRDAFLRGMDNEKAYFKNSNEMQGLRVKKFNEDFKDYPEYETLHAISDTMNKGGTVVIDD